MKRIIVNEDKQKLLEDLLLQEGTFNDQVLQVKKYLDDNFKRARQTAIGGKKIETVYRIDDITKDEVEQLTDTDLLDDLEDKFVKMFNKDNRRKELNNIMRHWYYGKIKSNGVLVNF